MNIVLGNRTAETVAVYFARTQRPEIRAFLPQKAQSVEEALSDYRETLLPSAKSYGRIILADGQYVGDVWCCCIDRTETPNAMLSYCVFDESHWNQGIATEAVALFLRDIGERFGLATVGAFTYADNIASLRVLEKNGFLPMEEFVEDGRASRYLQYSF